MIVMCVLNAMISVGGIGWENQVQMSGVVRAQSEVNYIVDFSRDAVKKSVMGDYSAKLIKKDQCVVMDEVK